MIPVKCEIDDNGEKRRVIWIDTIANAGGWPMAIFIDDRNRVGQIDATQLTPVDVTPVNVKSKTPN